MIVKNLIRTLVFSIIMFSINTSFAQNEVSLTVIGEGKTKEEAKYNALRSALEQAFGTFISSNTQILNDELIKDEIVSVSSGNIEEFEIKTEVQLPDGTFSNVVDVTVSVVKLKSFFENKGIKVDVQGGAFAVNIRIQKLNESNEVTTIKNMLQTVKKIAQSSYDYTLSVSEPQESDMFKNYYMVDLEVIARLNKNFENIEPIIVNTLDGVSLSLDEVKTYRSQNTDLYVVTLNNNGVWYLRSPQAWSDLVVFMDKMIPYYSTNFKIKSNIIEINCTQAIVEYIQFGHEEKYTQNYNEDSFFILDKIENTVQFIQPNFSSKESIFRVNYDGTSNLGTDYLKEDLRRNRSYARMENLRRENGAILGYINGRINIFNPPDVNFSGYKSVSTTFHLTHHMKLDQIEKLSGYEVIPTR